MCQSVLPRNICVYKNTKLKINTRINILSVQ